MRSLKKCSGGFTFVEIMVTLAIFSFGIVMIFKALILSLDQMALLTHRLYASVLLDNRSTKIEHMLQAYNTLPYELNFTETVNVGPKEIKFKQQMKIGEIEDYVDVFELDLTYRWQEKNREVSLSRSSYIADFKPLLLN